MAFKILFKCFNSALSQVVAVPDLFLTAVKLTHDKTGAQYLHAARDDSNNLFRLVSMCRQRLFVVSFSLTLVRVLQRPVSDDPHGQHGGPTHPGAHGAVRVCEVPLQRPLFQDAEPLPVHLHERVHRYRTQTAGLWGCVVFGSETFVQNSA